MADNLTATQERCTQLFLENQKLAMAIRERDALITKLHAALTLGMSVPPPSQLQWTMEELPIDGVPVPVKSTLPPAKTG